MIETINNNNIKATTCNNAEEKQDGTVDGKPNRITQQIRIDKDNIENNHETMQNLPSKNTKQEIHVQRPNRSNKRTVASQRLNRTIEYTSDLVRLTTSDQEMRQEYYRTKIELMKRNVIAKERIASALENISNIYPFSN